MNRILLCIFTLTLATKGMLAQSGLSKTPVLTETFIFPQVSQHTHGSSIVELPNGDFLAAWFQGSGERTADDVKIMGARLFKGSSRWSSPFLLADTPGLPDCNPVLFLNGQGKLFLVWIAVQANRWEHSLLRFKTSINYTEQTQPVWNWQDNILLNPGDTFSKETERKFTMLPQRNLGWSEFARSYDESIIEASKDPRKRTTGWMTRIKPLLMENGRIVLPLYSDGYSFSLMAISDDHGNTWHPSLPLISRGGIQPAIVTKRNGTLVAYLRDNGDAPNRVQRSESTDRGESWTAAVPTEIPNSGSSVELLALQDGKWAFIGNDVEDGRYRLSLYLSEDEGTSWKYRTALENEAPQLNGRYSYPALIQSADGLLHITYSCQQEKQGESIKYVVVDPKKIYTNK